MLVLLIGLLNGPMQCTDLIQTDERGAPLPSTGVLAAPPGAQLAGTDPRPARDAAFTELGGEQLVTLRSPN